MLAEAIGAVLDVILSHTRKHENWQDKERRVQKGIKRAMTKKRRSGNERRSTK